MTVEVRPATDADVAAIHEVGRATWPPTYGFAGDEYVAYGLHHSGSEAHEDRRDRVVVRL